MRPRSDHGAAIKPIEEHYKTVVQGIDFAPFFGVVDNPSTPTAALVEGVQNARTWFAHMPADVGRDET